MPRFEVEISEPPVIVDSRVSPGRVSSVVRSVYWAGNVANDNAVREAAWHAWDKMYGSGRQPIGAIMRVTD